MNPYALLAVGAAALATAFLLRRPVDPILWVGDSQSQYTAGWTLGPQIVTRLRSAGHDAHVVGLPGWGVVRYLNEGRFAEELQRLRPNTLIVQLGGNDAGLNLSPTAYTDRLVEFIQLARDNGVQRILWVGPSRSDDAAYQAKRAAIARTQQTVLPDLGVTWIDGDALTFDLPRHDGVHHTRDAYRTWAERLWPAIDRFL